MEDKIIPYCNTCAEEKGIQRTEKVQTTYCHWCNIHTFCSVNFKSAILIINPGIDLTSFSGIIKDNYFDTTNVGEKKNKEFTITASKQAGKILFFFKKHNRKFTPSDIWTNCFDVDSVPLTSIRRSITNLSTASPKNNWKPQLIKTTEKKQGIYGRPEYFWKLKI